MGIHEQDAQPKVIIGSRVPPRTSMFEHRDGMGGFSHTLPPMTPDQELLQTALLQRQKKPSIWRQLFDWITVK